MDILTTKGQATLRDEQRAHQIFTTVYPEYSYIQTPKDSPSDADAFLVKDGTIRALIETKCRYDCDIEKFYGQYEGNWLVTFDKLERCRMLSKSLCVDFVGFLYLKQSDVLITQKISDAAGNYVPRIGVKSTETQATVNGGKIIRTNAFIDMSNAKTYNV